MSEKVKSVFMGQVRRKMYFADRWHIDFEINESSEFVKTKQIYECELERPPLVEKEKIYIPELDVTLQVESILKSVDGSVIYKTNYTIETIEDEKTIKSKKDAQLSREKLIEDKTVRENLAATEEKVPVAYLESKEISRSLTDVGDMIIGTYKTNRSLTITNATTKDVIVLNNKELCNLIKFIEFAKANIQ